MARRARLIFAGVPQHIIQRGDNRQATFFAEEDYRSYLDWLHEAAKKYGCRIYAYVLMTNHVHLLASAEQPYDLSRMMQHLGRRFVRYVNRVYRRSGTLHRMQPVAGANDRAPRGLPLVKLPVSCARRRGQAALDP